MSLVKLTEADLRTAMRDPLYWGSHQPGQTGFRDWVTRGWRALAQAETRGGGTVHVRAYTRTRHGRTEQVSAYTQMRSGMDHNSVVLIAKQPWGGENKNSRGDPLPDMAGGGLGGVPRVTPQSRGAAAPTAMVGKSGLPSMAEILAPGGKAVGTAQKGSASYVRGLFGGDHAAREMFSRLTEGRGGVDVTPPTYPAGGKMLQLPDGPRIGYRPISSTGTPTIDINAPILWDIIRRIHFN